MEKKQGITNFFYGFLEHLRQDTVAKRISALQLSGSMEDYLVKEFIYFISEASEGTRLGVTNFGETGQQKVDIAILKQDSDDYLIDTVVEAKALRNRHRIWDTSDADTVRSKLKDLQQQTRTKIKGKHGGRKVQLSAKSGKTYALVFGSYVWRETDSENAKKNLGKDDKESFFKDCLEKADDCEFRYHDLEKSAWRKVFDDRKIRILGCNYYTSLRSGLWFCEDNGKTVS